MKHSRPRAKKWSATWLGESCSRCGKWLTKMQLVLLAALLASSLTTGNCTIQTRINARNGTAPVCRSSLEIVRLEVPSIADPRWDKVPLRCEYDLEGVDLYSVKWYKGIAEFFRYMPGSTPTGRDFPVDGVYVDLGRSDSKQVTLLGQANNRRGKVNLTGVYGCEVSSEGPNFLTAYSEANMTVAVLPKKPPTLYGLQPSYEAGSTLQVDCFSAPSYPPAQLTFILNDAKVSRTLTKELPSGDSEGSIVSSSRLSLSLRLERQHFPGGSLNLACQSVLPGISTSRALKVVESATLAASNQRLAQEPPRSACHFNLPTFSTILSCLLAAVAAATHPFRVNKPDLAHL